MAIEEADLELQEIDLKPREFELPRCPPKRKLVFLREHTYLKREPGTITCPNCLRAVETVVERNCTRATHLSALLLAPLCLCFVPYFSKTLRDAVHSCPSCGIYLGSRFASTREAFVVCFNQPNQQHSANNNEDHGESGTNGAGRKFSRFFLENMREG